MLDESLRDWHQSDEELARILEEMRPIIAEFARRARQDEAARPRSP
jgi:hypothetical protein